MPTIAEGRPHRTDEEIELLVKYCDAVRKKIEAGADYLNDDVIFHSYIAKCSHNMVVEPLIPIIDAAVILIANITRKELLEATIETHDRWCTALRSGFHGLRRAAMSMHLALNLKCHQAGIQKKTENSDRAKTLRPVSPVWSHFKTIAVLKWLLFYFA